MSAEFDNIAIYIENPELVKEVKEEKAEYEEFKLFQKQEEIVYCFSCGYRLNEFGLCPRCDLHGIGDPDSEDDIF